MDTTETIIQFDTLVRSKDSLGNDYKEISKIKTTTVHEYYENNCFKFCDCTLINSLIWPATIIFIILLFFKQIRGLIRDIGNRVKRGDGFKIGPSGFEMTREMNDHEIQVKAEKEYEETVTTEEKQNISIKKVEFIPKYFGIERRIFNLLLKHLYPEFRILSNRKMQGFEYDLIIETLGNKEFDLIAEVKYIPNRINKTKLQDTALKLSFQKDIYENTTQRKAKPILFIVVGNEIKIEDYKNLFEYINKPFTNKNFIRTIVTKESEIETISKLEVINLINVIE
ncbi:MAG: hypothetical protein FJX84_07665 [Bacteroidetes bacterium]|nr:hypothetical protein [Bacteroidota bacterium]